MLRTLTLDEVVEVTGGALVDGPQAVGASGEEVCTSVSTDTRTLEPGALFVALKGERHDAHEYLATAREKGAAALVVARTLTEVHLPHVVVTDTTHALGDIARYVRDAFTGPVVAVTGSVGKTTAKEMIATVLAAQHNVHKSAENFNNEIGVPQTLFELTAEHTAAVLEMGMRGPGQIRRLAEIAAPTVGVITNIGLSHVELLGSRDAIAQAKGELFECLPEDAGFAVYPAGDDFAAQLRARFKGKAYSCALDGPADFRAAGLVARDGGWAFRVESADGGGGDYFLPSPGRFNVLNALFAVAVGAGLGLSHEVMAAALRAWTPPKMRLEVLRSAKGATILSDAYNAAPDSMVGALETLRDAPVGPNGKRIAVLGEMRELGSFAPEAHSMVGRVAGKIRPDMLITVGELGRKIAAAALGMGFNGDHLHQMATTDQAAALVPVIVQGGDVVLVKGSRALGMERIVEAMKPVPKAAPPAPPTPAPPSAAAPPAAPPVEAEPVAAPSVVVPGPEDILPAVADSPVAVEPETPAAAAPPSLPPDEATEAAPATDAGAGAGEMPPPLPVPVTTEAGTEMPPPLPPVSAGAETPPPLPDAKDRTP